MKTRRYGESAAQAESAAHGFPGCARGRATEPPGRECALGVSRAFSEALTVTFTDNLPEQELEPSPTSTSYRSQKSHRGNVTVEEGEQLCHCYSALRQRKE